MGTSNFHNVNAKCIYPVLMNYEINKEDEDGNELDEKETVQADDFDYECLIDSLVEKLNALNMDFSLYGHDENELRSFPSRVVGTINQQKEIGGLIVGVSLTCVIRSGYYEGANLDYNLYQEINGEDLVDITDQYDFYSPFKGISKIHAEIADKWIETTQNKMIDLVENIYAEISDVKLRKVATFSNGETIFETC